MSEYKDLISEISNSQMDDDVKDFLRALIMAPRGTLSESRILELLDGNIEGQR